MPEPKPLSSMDLPLDRDIFLRNLLRELSGTLETVVGIDEAAGFISLVGQHIGDWMNSEYRKALQLEQLNLEQVKDVLVDLKARIEGGFSIESFDAEKIVLVNNRCPFGDRVVGRPSLCMMTSNVFGTVTAENLGYAKVRLNKTIAQGDAGCHVVIYLNPNDESEQADGREYFQS
ncbi:MAG: methanogen output domain 1-containing protein [Gammaproteobacteria bacterium]